VKEMNFTSGVKSRSSDRWWERRWWVVTVMRWYAQKEVNEEDSEQNEFDGMKKGADSTGKMMHMWKSGWRFVMRKIQVVELGWQQNGERVLHVDWTEISLC